ncbi:MAG: hypothetical protein ACHQFZ_02660, partial [Acidimicrobiales bacterium]
MLTAIVATLVTVVPLAVVSTTSSASDESSFLVFGPPAVGSNGVYTDSVTSPSTYSVPAVTNDGQRADATFSVIGDNTAGCSVAANGSDFTYARAGECVISAVASTDPDEGSSGALQSHDEDGTASATLTLTVRSGVQTIAVTPATGPALKPLTLVATGFSGTGAITFAVVAGGTAKGCAVSAAQLTATSGGTCKVTATIAAGGGYGAATSDPATITFSLLGQSIAVTPQSGTVGTNLTLTATGYTGTGAITFAVASGGTAPGCAISAGSFAVASGAGTCLVTASIAADSTYLSATSLPATMNFYVLPPVGALEVTASSETVAAGSPVNESSVVSGVLSGDSAHLDSVSYTFTGTGSTSYGPSSSVPGGAGTYTVMPFGATITISPSAHQTHYLSTITYHPGNLTITGTHLTITASSESLTAGTSYQETASVSGELSGDGAAVSAVTFTYTGAGATTYGPTSSAPSAAGAYTVTPSGATVAVTPAGHQSYYPVPFTYVAGSLVLTPAPLVIP